jgi:predicted enzyme related to lactoylglutathione lyase
MREILGTRQTLFAMVLGAALTTCPGSMTSAAAAPAFSVGPEYDTTHVYVAPADFDSFVASILATFGGSAHAKAAVTVTPTPSRSFNQAVLTPAGAFSVFGFTTPVPYPFGGERVGYLVTDMDAAVAAARADGAAVIVSPFPDPIGRDAVVQWPGGINMQFYWHTKPSTNPKLATVPENRVYVSPDKADEFVRSFVRFSHGRIVSDDAKAPGVEIGRMDAFYRRIRLESGFGRVVVLVTDGHLPAPYGRETTGFEVAALPPTLDKAKKAGAKVLVGPYQSEGRNAAMMEFPGGVVVEIHAVSR